jgi:hypothetical protein
MSTTPLGTRLISSLATGLAFFIMAGVASAQVKTQIPDSLAKQAKVTEAAARKTAMASAPKGATLEEVELEREKGHLQYSYDFKVAGKKGTTEVNVDAVTGKLINVEHEDEAAEAKENKAPPAKKP